MNCAKKTLALMMAVFLLLSAAGCGNQPQSSQQGDQPQSNAEYSVSIHTQGGMALSGIDVYVYEDASLQELVQFAKTDESGSISVNMPSNGDYAIVLSGVPKGYAVAESYQFNGVKADLVLESALIQNESLSNAALGVGDVMYDFSVTTPAGETVTLSEMLQEKEMVLLNFWYTTCTYCVQEFPYMEQAYQQFQDKVGIIALNPLQEGNNAIQSFLNSYGLTFPMAECPTAWSAVFGISGYPTSVVVDRYGVICLVEAGGILSLRPFTTLFEHFTGDDYEQKLLGSLSELVSNVKPNVTMPDPEEIAAAINVGDVEVTYRPEEGDDAEYSWPFVVTEKNGRTCIKSTNQDVEASYSILYADLYLKEGQAIGLEYLSSTERGSDVLHIIVNDEPVFAISGADISEQWQRCYPWVAQEDGFYEVALCYIKDADTNVGDDTVYLDNLRVVDANEIDVPTYIPQYAATEVSDLQWEYADIVYNESDGYYHVGEKNGPLLLADLMNYSQFNEEETVWELVYNGDATINGESFYDDMVNYFSYASNSSMNGVCTVNQELADWLKIIADSVGFSEDEFEWLKICKYYEVYGPDDGQLTDPIKGLATFCAYEAKLGADNYFYYDRPIMPRGLLAKFVPNKSGVYRITSHSDEQNGVEGWIFQDENAERDSMYTFEPAERMFSDLANVSMVYYMEAGENYYIDIAFWDIYATGYINYEIEYVAEEFDLFRLASPGYFTYDTNATGDAMYALISGGVKAVLGEDGKYYVDAGKDANGKQRYGSLLYCDFTGVTDIFNLPLADVNVYEEDGSIKRDENGDPVIIRGLIERGGFDFSKTENDLYILDVLTKYDGDVDSADAYLREYWGEDYEENAEVYQLEDVYTGRYHGGGEDYTDEMRGYLKHVIKSGAEEKQGCVVVTERLAELLQMLMDKYTFSGVENSWTKLCYYYQHLGPN